MPSLSQIHRPKRFEDVTGQEHITNTLKQEIITGRLGHVFLFSGPRGVGKTTTARIFARAINCLDRKEGEPCGVCASCVQTERQNLDVIELDAATHNGVDAVRESIIEHVRFAPASGHQKVYILDEAHMLSTAAWNALLKTLEEPPAYAFFILATTEWHKVPATILSRCQQFTFKRIPDEAMSARLKLIASVEGWVVEPEALALIVRKADGCLRDAETLLGQLGGLGQKTITLKTVELIIPVGQRQQAIDVVAAWAKGSFEETHECLQRLSDEGVSFLALCDELLEVLQELLAREAKGVSSAYVDLGHLVGLLTVERIQQLALEIFERRRDIKMGMNPEFALQLIGLSFLRQSKTVAPPAGVTTSSKTIETSMPKVEVEKKEIIKATIPEPVNITPEPPATTMVAPAVTISKVRSMWSECIQRIGEKNHSLPLVLKTATVSSVEGNTIVLKFAYAFHRDRLIQDGKNKTIIQEVMRSMFQNPELLVEGIVAEEKREESSTDVVGNILQAFGGSVVES